MVVFAPQIRWIGYFSAEQSSTRFDNVKAAPFEAQGKQAAALHIAEKMREIVGLASTLRIAAS
jgi:hypothetical protein